MYASKSNIKIKALTINMPKIQDYHHEVQEAVREVYKDRIICAYAGYKTVRYKLSTKSAVAKAVVDGHISRIEVAKLLGMTFKSTNSRGATETTSASLRNWIKDYKQGKLRLENACAIRRV